jgi:ferritin-like protein
MPSGSTTFHEAEERLSPKTRDMHRAVVSLMEELEAIDWYQQRVDAAGDDDLRAILAHNRDEEIEHAVMTLEWIRRQSPTFDAMLRQYLFTEGSITAIEDAAPGQENGKGSARTTVGSLRGGGR